MDGSVLLLFDREGVGRGGGGGSVGFGTYGGMVPMGRGGNVHGQQVGAGSSLRPGSAGSAPAASFAEPYNFVSYTPHMIGSVS